MNEQVAPLPQPEFSQPPQGPAPSQRSRKRWGIVLLIPLVAGLAVLLLLAREWKNTLKVQKVVITGARIIPAADLLTAAKVQSRSLMSMVNLYDVRERLLQHPYVRSVSVNREYPGTLRITIEERDPIAALGGGQIRYIDADGFVLPYIQSPVALDLPLIANVDGIDSVPVQHAVTNPEYTEAINVLQAALAVDSSVYHFISEVNMNHGGDILLVTTEVGAQIRLGRGDIARKLVTLRSFWNQCLKSGDAERLSSVDLRFDDQVVVRWNPSATQHNRQKAL